MPYFEFEEEAEIDADTSTIFKILLDMNNWSRWWPGHMNKIRGDEKVIRKGSIVDIKLKGHTPMTINLVAEITDITENKFIKAEWEKDLVGPVEWKLTPSDGKTVVGFHIKVRTDRPLISFFAIFLSPKKIFLEIMRSGFECLQKYLK